MEAVNDHYSHSLGSSLFLRFYLGVFGFGGDVMDWQPIETAPKDGSRFIAWHPDGYADFFHWQDNGPKYPESPVGFRDGFIQVFPEGTGPTHWMPLPAPPKHE